MQEEVNFTEKEKSNKKNESQTYGFLHSLQKQSCRGPFSSAE